MRRNIKLHLGCGQRYLAGYCNIDYPQKNHTVQLSRKVDLEADIAKLKYRNGSVDEIRMHHVFEHFPRTVACALVGCWNSWLRKGGLLRIEVPDFERTAIAFLSPFTSMSKKGVALRHVFGSQEATWAVHYNGWTKNQLENLLGISGFGISKVAKNSYCGTYNIEVFAKKEINLNKDIFLDKCGEYLSNYLVDNSDTEKLMLKVWLKDCEEQINKSWAF